MSSPLHSPIAKKVAPPSPIQRSRPTFATASSVADEEMASTVAPSAKDVEEEIDELLSDSESIGGSRKVQADQKVCRWDNCEESFEGVHDLVRHVHDGHIGQNKDGYICKWENCSRNRAKQSSRHSLVTHMRSHTGERPYTCSQPGCGRNFTRSDALAKHLRSLHNINPDGSFRPGGPIIPGPSSATMRLSKTNSRTPKSATTNKPLRSKKSVPTLPSIPAEVLPPIEIEHDNHRNDNDNTHMDEDEDDDDDELEGQELDDNDGSQAQAQGPPPTLTLTKVPRSNNYPPGQGYTSGKARQELKELAEAAARAEEGKPPRIIYRRKPAKRSKTAIASPNITAPTLAPAPGLQGSGSGSVGNGSSKSKNPGPSKLSKNQALTNGSIPILPPITQSGIPPVLHPSIIESDRDLMTDPDISEVLPRIRNRSRFWSVSTDDSRAVAFVREKYPRIKYPPPSGTHHGAGSVNNKIEELEGLDGFDEEIAEMIPPGEAHVIGRLLLESQGDPRGERGERGGGEEVEVHGRTKWQARYIMAKVKLMLVEEENRMRKNELAKLMEMEAEWYRNHENTLKLLEDGYMKGEAELQKSYGV